MVSSYEEGESLQPPGSPFTTSFLQQAASTGFKLNPKETMEPAQRLYEGGHNAYMRTDSPNPSAEAIYGNKKLRIKKGPAGPIPENGNPKTAPRKLAKA
jgi:DNA topoisomerase IA